MKKILLILLLGFQLFGITFEGMKKESLKYKLVIFKEYKTNFQGTNCYNQYTYNIMTAQIMQESQFKTTAKSYVGAAGLMQIMPKTFEGINKKFKLTSDVWDPHTNIKFGIYYDKTVYDMWKSKRTEESRVKLMFASYNAGAGNLLKAQKKSGGAAEYNDIEASLHLITGKYSEETKTYVKRIFNYYNKLEK